jgi:hypothetical protein
MAALQALSQIGSKDGFAAVKQSLESKDPNVRSSAVAALGAFEGSDADKAILEAFRDSYYKTRIAAAQAAKERKLAAAVPYLRYRVERDEVPAVKDESIRALGAINNSDAIGVLAELFKNRKNPDRVRILCGEMLMTDAPDNYAQLLVAELQEAQKSNLRSLYSGLLKDLGQAKTSKLEDFAKKLFKSHGALERAYALDLAEKNKFVSLSKEIQILCDPKYGSLSDKAKAVAKKLGISDKPPPEPAKPAAPKPEGPPE